MFSPTNNNVNTEKCRAIDLIDTKSDIENYSNHKSTLSSIVTTNNDFHIVEYGGIDLDDIESGSDHEISLSSMAPIIVFNLNTAKSKVNNTSDDTVMAKNTKSDIENSDHKLPLPLIATSLCNLTLNTVKSKVNNISDNTLMAKNTKSDIENSDHKSLPLIATSICNLTLNTAKSKVNNISDDTVMSKNTKSDIENSDHKLPLPLITTSLCNLNTTQSREFVFNATKSGVKNYSDHEINTLLPIQSHKTMTINNKSETYLISNNEESSLNNNNMSKYVCDICGETFLKRILIIEHFKTSLCFPESTFNFENNSSMYNGFNNFENSILNINSKNNLELNNMKEAYKCNICQTAIPNNKLIKNSQIFCTKNDLKCKTCSKVNGVSYKNTQHTKEEYVCKTCGKLFINLSLLKVHRFIHPENKSCNIDKYDASYINCSNNRNLNLTSENHYKYFQNHFDSKSYASKYISKIHNSSQYYKCSKCSIVFYKRSDIIFHIFKTHQEDYSKHSCDTCSNVCGSSQEFVLHLEKNVLKCAICPQTFITSHRLHQHYKWHLGINNFKCQYCPKIFSNYSVYFIHEKMHTQKNPFRCNFCGEWFPFFSNLNIHLKFNDPVVCGICEKVFFQMSSLLSHRRIHKKEKILKNKSNNESFNQSSTADMYTKQHNNRKLYSCNICKRFFVQSSALSAHLKTHINEDNHYIIDSPDEVFTKLSLNKPKSTLDGYIKCDLCQEIFSDRNIFNAHRCTSCECTFCRKLFNNSSSLKKHYKKIHKNKKPYQCDLCKTSFLYLTNLNKHKEKHIMYEENMAIKWNVKNSVNGTEENVKKDEYRCDLCKTSFYKQTDIVAHILRTHY